MDKHPNKQPASLKHVKNLVTRSASNDRRGRKPRNLFAVRNYDRRTRERRQEN